MYTNSKSAVDRKENKQRNFAESETRHLNKSHNKNAENAIFRTRDGGTSILGEMYNAGNNWKSKEEREAPYAVDGRNQKCNLLVNNISKKRKRTNI